MSTPTTPDVRTAPTSESKHDSLARLARLRSQVQGHAAKTATAAQLLKIEVDGLVVARVEPTTEFMAVALPSDAVSLTLRDENDVARAHLLLAESSLDTALYYDDDRIALKLERPDPLAAYTLCLRCPA